MGMAGFRSVKQVFPTFPPASPIPTDNKLHGTLGSGTSPCRLGHEASNTPPHTVTSLSGKGHPHADTGRVSPTVAV
ncbi:hypothetical protein GCM10010315_13030 [Streptomyces luteosporeus]|uniref:Uncharacterized protein n=1 Tax=Streptomyces luteosporeus TaxID=173856 RepID=A0ABN3TMD8_9ACTN